MNPSQRAEAKRRSDRFRIALKRSWQNGSHSTSGYFHRASLDPDTARFRANEDARGQVEFIAILPDRSGVIMQRSVCGRINQFDLVWDGHVVFTGRAELCVRELLEMSGAVRGEKEGAEKICV